MTFIIMTKVIYNIYDSICFDSRCNLCLEEKIQIMIYPDPEKLLNKRCELIARCRHRTKFKL